MLTMLDAFASTRLLAGVAFCAAVQACGNRSASPYLQSCWVVNPSTNFTVLSENASLDTTYIPSSLEMPACCSIAWMFCTAVDVRVDPLDRVRLDLELVLHEHAADEDDERRDRERRRDLPRHAAEPDDETSERGPRGSRAPWSASGTRGCRGPRASP